MKQNSPCPITLQSAVESGLRTRQRYYVDESTATPLLTMALSPEDRLQVRMRLRDILHDALLVIEADVITKEGCPPTRQF